MTRPEHTANQNSRRQFLCTSAVAAGAFAFASPRFSPFVQAAATELPFKISLAEWSLHKSLQSGKIDNLNFAKISKEEYGIDAIEFVNQFFKDKANDGAYLADLNKRAAEHGVKHVLIMIDGEGQLGDTDDAARTKAVKNHYKWVDASKTLGCHSIRVNAGTQASYDEGKKLAADGLRRLSEYAAKTGINVIVENHGGLSSNGKWLSETIASVGLPNCGTLPDFGNFVIDRATGEEYDRYQGVTELMPFAKSVSAKTHDFDDAGNETHRDYVKMMKIVLQAGYHGYVGIEYEGSKIGEKEGILATKALLERLQKELA